MRALDVIRQLKIGGKDLSHVIMKKDSEYLAKGLSRWG